MPRVVQLVTYVDPIRVIVRGVLLKGLGLDVLWPQYAVLLAFGLLTPSVASSRFRKTLG